MMMFHIWMVANLFVSHFKNRSPQMVIDEYSWLRTIGCEKEGTLDGILLLALVATHQLHG